MAEFFTLEKLPNTDKKVRVVWDTTEYDWNELDVDNYIYEYRGIYGIGEDGTNWIKTVTVNVNNEDDWDDAGDTELTSSIPNEEETLLIVDNKAHIVDRYWDEDGRLQWLTNKARNKEVSIKEYFKQKVGDYPNIDITKGAHWLEKREMRKNPEVMLMSVMSYIPVEKIAANKSGAETEFYRVPKIINGEEKIVTVPTQYGLIKNLLMANNYTWQNEIKPVGINHNELEELKRNILKFLF